jgi:hypothetical protein
VGDHLRPVLTSSPIRLRPFQVHAGAGGRRLFFSATDNTQAWIPSSLATKLVGTRESSDIPALVRNQGSEGRSGPLVTETLSESDLEALFVSSGQLFESLLHCATVSRITDEACIGIPTCNRKEELKRLLFSLISSSESNGRRYPILIADSSDLADVSTENRSLVRELMSSRHLDIRYYGAHERAELLKNLTAAGVPEDVTEFALNGLLGLPSAGSNRNLLLLLSQGRRLVSMDDDVTCRVISEMTQLEPHVELCSIADPTNIYLFKDRSSLYRGRRFANSDIVSDHLQRLGSGMEEIASKVGAERVDIKALSYDLATRILEYRRTYIALTMAGIGGDPGTSSNAYVLRCRNTEYYDRTRVDLSDPWLCSRTILRCTDHFVASDQSYFMTTSAGFDNRDLLPPFLSTLRGQDQLFATCVRAIYPGALTGFLPFAQEHLPPNGRSASINDIYNAAGEVSTSEAIGLLIHRVTHGAIKDCLPLTALRYLATQVTAASELSDVHLLTLLRELIIPSRTVLLGQLDELSEVDDDPNRLFHRRLYRDELARQMRTKDFAIPGDSCRTGQKTVTEFRGILRNFGRVLEWWPTMLDIAATQL